MTLLKQRAFLCEHSRPINSDRVDATMEENLATAQLLLEKTPVTVESAHRLYIVVCTRLSTLSNWMSAFQVGLKEMEQC